MSFYTNITQIRTPRTCRRHGRTGVCPGKSPFSAGAKRRGHPPLSASSKTSALQGGCLFHTNITQIRTPRTCRRHGRTGVCPGKALFPQAQSAEDIPPSPRQVRHLPFKADVFFRASLVIVASFKPSSNVLRRDGLQSLSDGILKCKQGAGTHLSQERLHF